MNAERSELRSNAERGNEVKALANELVQVHPLEHQLLVQFLHMWIREIDLKTGRSLTLVDKNHNPYV
ncbi:MAG: hypothetical protein PHU88_08680 [candidate division Zixibacteria bacterium]|nr:hypothetical protein [candidate division Zixibacteria bacterium]